MSNASAPARLGAMDPLPARGVPNAGCIDNGTRAGRADGRRGAHRALFHRLRHQARARGRHRARALASAATPRDLPEALRRYEAVRSVEVQRIQNAARNSTEWFENVARYADLPPEQFAYSLLTRSQRISHENLRLRDRRYLEDYEDWVAEQRRRRARRRADGPSRRCSRRSRLRGVTLKNRVVVSPMAQYSCVDGTAGGLPPRAPRRARDGRRGPRVRRDDLRLRRRAHHARLPGAVERSAARRLEAHRRLRARRRPTRKIAMQLGHAGAKGSTRVPWEGDRRAAARRQLAADLGVAAAVPRRHQRLVAGDDPRRHGSRARRLRSRDARLPPRPASTGSSCTARTATCCRASSRRSPTCARTSTAARSPTACAIRWKCSAPCATRGRTHLPMSVRISAHDWVEGGITPDDAVRDRARVQGGGRGHDRLLVGPGQQQAAARVRPHVPDAVRRSRPQRGRHRDHRRRRDLRGRPRQQHHRGGARRPVRARTAASREPGLDAAWRPPRSATSTCRGRSSTARRRRSSSATSSASAQQPRRQPAVAAGAGQSPLGVMCEERRIAHAPARRARARPRGACARRRPCGAQAVAAPAGLHDRDRGRGAAAAARRSSASRSARFDYLAQLVSPSAGSRWASCRAASWSPAAT